MAAHPQLTPGTVMLGQVRADAMICVGGIGALHWGKSTASSKPVLVRVMTSDSLGRAADSFAREVLVVRHLEHEGVVAPLDAGVEDGHAVIAYEPVTGTVLQTRFPGEPLPVDEAVRILTELAAILDYSHRQAAPVFHAALSASSVVLTESGAVRLLDLGVVQALDRAHLFPEATWELLDAACVSPEQVSRTFPISAATDVFGLASLAFECLTGRAPFPATNAAEADALIVAGKRPSARAARTELHPDVDRVLWMAWSVDPRGRHHDTQELLGALTAALSRPPMPALLDVPTGPTIRGALPNELFDRDEANTVIQEPKNEDDEPTAIREPIPSVIRRAQTLPFGLPKHTPSDPPPNDRTTVPRIEAAVEVSFESEVPPPMPIVPAAPPPVIVPPVVPEDVKTVRVVNVTGLLVSLILAGSIMIAGAFVGAGQLTAQRAKPEPVAAPAPPAPHSVSATATASTPPPPIATPSVAPTMSAPPVATVQPAAWADMPKEAGPRPSAKAMDAVHQRLKKEFEPCIKLKPLPPAGVPWMVHFEFDGPTGRPSTVELSRPFKGTIHGTCMLRSALDARVPPFDSARWSIDLKFGP